MSGPIIVVPTKSNKNHIQLPSIEVNQVVSVPAPQIVTQVVPQNAPRVATQNVATQATQNVAIQNAIRNAAQSYGIYSSEQIKECTELITRHLKIYECVFNLHHKIRNAFTSNYAGTFTKDIIDIAFMRIISTLKNEEPDYIDRYMKSFYASSVASWFFFKNHFIKSGNSLITFKDYLISYDDSAIASSIIHNKFLMSDAGYDCKSLPTKMFSIVPQWFGTKIDTIVFAALCGNIFAFRSYYANLEGDYNILTENMDYAALFGGDATIITFLENANMRFTHQEACILSHKTHVLVYGLRNWNFSDNNDSYIKCAVDANNLKALLLFKPSKNFITSNTTLLTAAVLRLVHQANQEHYADHKHETELSTNKYYNKVKIMRSDNFQVQTLSNIFSRCFAEINYPNVSLAQMKDYTMCTDAVNFEDFITNLANNLIKRT